jgi:Fic family protein
MFAEQFDPGQAMHLRRTERGYPAFVPPALPPVIDYDQELMLLLSAADQAVGKLAGIGQSLPNLEILTAPIVRREAVLSSRIEGTQASESDLALFELDAVRDGGDVKEIFNYVAALNQVTDPDRRLPLSVPLLLEAHRILMTGVRGGYATPGEVRRSQNWIGPPGCTLADAAYVPPPVELLWPCLDAFEKYLYAEDRMPRLLQIGCLHYQFEAIHPFIDGNGRVGRLLIILLLLEWRLLPAPILDLSAWIEPRRDAYYEKLLHVTTRGDWTGWLRFFLEGIAAQANDAAERALRLQRLREAYRSAVATPRASAMLPQLVDSLFVIPALTIPHARKTLGVSSQAASANVARLVDAGILVEIENPGRLRLFAARDIIATASGTRRQSTGSEPQ